MKVKRYFGKSMRDALAQVKSDLGSDAVILQTKTFRRGGILGLWGKQVVEITASDNLNILRSRRQRDAVVADRPRPRQARCPANWPTLSRGS